MYYPSTKTKALIRFAFAKCLFSHDVAHIGICNCLIFFSYYVELSMIQSTHIHIFWKRERERERERELETLS